MRRSLFALLLLLAACPAKSPRPPSCEGVTCPATACREAGACNPATGECEAALKPAGTVCRPAAGPCDLEDTCSGKAATCPADRLVPAGTACRPASGACDLEDSCSGASAACADRFAPATTVCRPAAGPCDAAESCTGIAATCPADAFAPATTSCRASAAPCDAPEQCPGDGPACPADAPALECAPYSCAAGACRAACATSLDCAGDRFCSGGVCRARDYVEHWAGGDLARDGLALAIAPDGTRVLATVHGRRLALYTSQPGAKTWTAEIVSPLASYPALALGPDGAVHLAWEEQGIHRVWHAQRSASGWTTTLVDGGGMPSLAVDSRGEPHLAYHSVVGVGSENRYATRKQGRWVREPITGGGGLCGCINDPLGTCSCGIEPGRPRLRLDAQDRPLVLAPRFGSRFTGLELGTRGDQGWQFEDIEPSAFLENATSFHLGANGAAGFLYAMLGDSLRYASKQAGKVTRVETGLTSAGATALWLGASARHACGFVERTDFGVFYATDASGSWVRTVLDPKTAKGVHCAVALDRAGAVHVAYRDGESGRVKLAGNASGTFQVELVAESPLYAGVPALAASAEATRLAVARRRLAPGASSWNDYDVALFTKTTGAPSEQGVTDTGAIRPHVDLGVDPSGRPHLAWFQDLAGSVGLRHAVWEGAWKTTAVTSTATEGAHFQLALSPTGLPRVAYPVDHGNVSFAQSDGAAWTATSVGLPASWGFALALGPTGAAHLLLAHDGIRWATDTSGTWAAEPISTVMPAGSAPAIAETAQGVAAVFALDARGLQYAWRPHGATAWTVTPIPEGEVRLALWSGGPHQLVFDGAGEPHLFGVNDNREVVELHRAASGWRSRALDRVAGGVEGCSASVGADGRIHVAYLAEQAVHHLVVPVW